MRITESTIRRIIREEARRVLGTGSLRINESDFEDEEEDDFEDEDTDDEDTDDEEQDFDDDGEKYPGERRYSPDEIDQFDADAEEDRKAFDADDEEDFDEDFDIPGMRGVPDVAYIATQIVDQLGDDASQSFYDDCMFNSNPQADNELEAYIEDFGGGAFDGSDESHQLKVLQAISHILRGIGPGNRTE